MPKIPRDIQEMAERIRIEKEKTIKVENSKGRNEQKNLGVMLAFQVSSELVAGILVGAGIGYILDELFDFHSFFLLIFIILGCMAGILNVYRSMKKMDESKGKE